MKTAELQHNDGCPGDPARVETYELKGGPRDGYRRVQVTRCCTCGAHQVRK